MKNLNLSKIIGASVLILSTAFLVFTLSACEPTPVTTIPPTTVAPRVVYTDGGFDWGLLGLLGLLGLGGLSGVTKRKNRDTDIRYQRYLSKYNLSRIEASRVDCVMCQLSISSCVNLMNSPRVLHYLGLASNYDQANH